MCVGFFFVFLLLFPSIFTKVFMGALGSELHKWLCSCTKILFTHPQASKTWSNKWKKKPKNKVLCQHILSTSLNRVRKFRDSSLLQATALLANTLTWEWVVLWSTWDSPQPTYVHLFCWIRYEVYRIKMWHQTGAQNRSTLPVHFKCTNISNLQVPTETKRHAQ